VAAASEGLFAFHFAIAAADGEGEPSARRGKRFETEGGEHAR